MAPALPPSASTTNLGSTGARRAAPRTTKTMSTRRPWSGGRREMWRSPAVAATNQRSPEAGGALGTWRRRMPAISAADSKKEVVLKRNAGRAPQVDTMPAPMTGPSDTATLKAAATYPLATTHSSSRTRFGIEAMVAGRTSAPRPPEDAADHDQVRDVGLLLDEQGAHGGGLRHVDEREQPDPVDAVDDGGADDAPTTDDASICTAISTANTVGEAPCSASTAITARE
jgi:hypothetical protein